MGRVVLSLANDTQTGDNSLRTELTSRVVEAGFCLTTNASFLMYQVNCVDHPTQAFICLL